jgi:hypothetical protein
MLRKILLLIIVILTLASCKTGETRFIMSAPPDASNESGPSGGSGGTGGAGGGGGGG